MAKPNLRSLIIPQELWNELQEEAKQKNISISAYVRMILSSRNNKH